MVRKASNRLPRISVVFVVLLVLNCCAAGAATKPASLAVTLEGRAHPYLTCTSEELQRLRHAYRGSGPEHDAVAAPVREAEGFVDEPVVFPPRGGQHNQWYQCDDCETALRTVDPTHHQCPRCQKVYTGHPYDDVIFSRRHARNLGRMEIAAWAYAISGRKPFAEYAAGVLLGYAQRYTQYPYHSASLETESSWGRTAGGHLYEQTLTEASALATRIGPAYDLIHDSGVLSNSQHERIREGLLRPMLENIGRNKAGKSNWQTWHNAAMMWGGALVEDPAWIERTVLDRGNGFYDQMKVSVSREGMWYENSWGYHFYTLKALVIMAETGRRLGDLLVSEGLVSADEVLEALSRQLDLPIRASIRADVVDETLVERLPIGFCKHHVVLPLQRDLDGAVRVAVANPLALEPIDDLRMLFEGSEVRLELANQRTILGAINEVYDRGPGSTDALAEDAADDLDHLAEEISQEPQDLLDASDDAPIIKLVNSLLQHAVKERASDVHLEPFEREIRVRFRIDDVLYEPMKPLPRALQASIVSRIKIMGGLNIAEKRLPQDGRIRLKIAGRDYDVRLSTIPIAHGERVVLRLLPRTQDLLNLERIGFNEQQLAVMERLISRPNGIILVTGPTGSGKTTTLYAGLSRINATDKNIITIEDPVEIQLGGIGQIEVKPQIGLTFASGLRSVLRQDPNVILVGEIRDLETAEIAIQASLTGHLVFSTLHTNDAPSALTRLIDMGVKPFLVASSVQAIMAQRLVRILCDRCRAVDPDPDPRMLKLVGITESEKQHVHRPVGCAHCGKIGFRGRKAIFEMMKMNTETRELAFNRASIDAIRDAAVRNGMKPLVADGKIKILRGDTTPAEVARFAQAEELLEANVDI